MAAALLLMSTVTLQVAPARADASGGYSAWESLQGVARGAPAITTWGQGRLDVFVAGTDANLYHKYYTGAWSGWENLGAPAGGLTTDPAAVAWASGRIDVFATGANLHLWHKAYDAGWSAWEDLGGTLMSAPAVASWGPGRLDLFVEGTDQAMWHKAYAAGWSNWDRIGGVISAAPAATSWSPGRLDVVVRGNDQSAWHTFFDGAWHGFDSLGGGLTSAPAIATTGTGQLDVLARGTDNALWQRWYANGWSSWQSVGGQLTSAPAAVSWGANRVDVVVTGTDSAVWHTFTVGGSPARGWQTAVAAAQQELGKPYVWGGAGPDSFDCSGLTMWSWATAGVALPHQSQLQYNMTAHVAISDLQPGDLVFYGGPTSVYHVGIYVGGGTMIDAPQPGEVVHYTTIYFSGLLGGGRVSN